MPHWEYLGIGSLLVSGSMKLGEFTYHTHPDLLPVSVLGGVIGAGLLGWSLLEPGYRRARPPASAPPGWWAQRLSDYTWLLTSPSHRRYLLVTMTGQGDPQGPMREETRRYRRHLAGERRSKILWHHLQPGVGQVDVIDDAHATLVRGPNDFACAQLQRFEQMHVNLHGTPETSAASRWGREVEDQAIEAALARRPAGWTLEANPVLDVGGDADLVAQAPSGQLFVVEIKSRTQRPDAPDRQENRQVSWQDIHDQVVQAARQWRATPVLWLPQAARPDRGTFGPEQVLWVGGDADALFNLLTRHAAPHLN